MTRRIIFIVEGKLDSRWNCVDEGKGRNQYLKLDVKIREKVFEKFLEEKLLHLLF